MKFLFNDVGLFIVVLTGMVVAGLATYHAFQLGTFALDLRAMGGGAVLRTLSSAVVGSVLLFAVIKIQAVLRKCTKH